MTVVRDVRNESRVQCAVLLEVMRLLDEFQPLSRERALVIVASLLVERLAHHIAHMAVEHGLRRGAGPGMHGRIGKTHVLPVVDIRDRHRQVVGDGAQTMFAVGQAALRSTARRHVGDQRIESVHATGGVDIGYVFDLLEHFAVLGPDRALERCRLSGKRLGNVGRHAGVLLAAENRVELLADDQGDIEIEHRAVMDVAELQALLRIDVADQCRHVVSDHAHPALIFQQADLARAARRDVVDRADEAGHPAVDQYRCGQRMHQHDLSVRMYVAELAFVAIPMSRRGNPSRGHALPVVRVNCLPPAKIERPVAVQATHYFEGAIDIRERTVDVRIEQTERRGVIDDLQFCPALAQLLGSLQQVGDVLGDAERVFDVAVGVEQRQRGHP